FTDTDTKERGALIDVWPNIWLLLCKFHLRQCWTNKRKALKLVPGIDESDFWKDYAHGQFLSLEVCLIETTKIGGAHQLIENERKNLEALRIGAQHIISAGLKYLDYLVKTWMPEALWQSWSRHGRLYPSTILKCPVKEVLPTTNHLKLFNGLLKKKYLPRWQHSGTRLRIDFLILTLITKILPEIFNVRHSIQRYKSWLTNRFQNLGARQHQQQSSPTRTGLLCWWAPDSKWDAEAQSIVHLKRIYNINQALDRNQYDATCVSSRSVLGDPASQIYHIYIHRDGHAGCTCPDFATNGCACKHLRALRLIID
ncbi:hypothetical protein C8R43DRAFT_824503, partial [Mycena crocata]